MAETRKQQTRLIEYIIEWLKTEAAADHVPHAYNSPTFIKQWVETAIEYYPHQSRIKKAEAAI